MRDSCHFQPSTKQCELGTLHPISTACTYVLWCKTKKTHYKSVVKNDGNAKRWAIEYSVLDNALYSIDIEYHDCYSEHGLFNKK